MGKNKRPRAAAEPFPTKSPRVEVNPDKPQDMRPVWRVQFADLAGKWSWKNIDAAGLLSLQERLRSLESMMWREIDRAPSCGLIPVSALCKEAQGRLEALSLDDLAELYKIRLTSAGRIWGIRDRQIFNVLWWDPDHSVYPMNLANN